MSRFFVDADERDPIYEFDPATVVSDVPPNIIWIRRRPTVGSQNRVKGALFRLDKSKQDVEADFGANLNAMLLYNILDWEGPDFVDAHGKRIPITPENIERLVDGDPFIARVIEEITRRNRPAESPNPKSHDTSGSTSDGDGFSGSTPKTPSAHSNLWEPSTPMLSSPNGSTGLPSKSTD